MCKDKQLIISFLLFGVILGGQQDQALSLEPSLIKYFNKIESTYLAQVPSSVIVKPGLIEVPLGIDEIVNLPDGTRVEPDGKIIRPNGLIIKLIRRKDGTFAGPQIVMPDGTELKAGEVRRLPDGTEIEQPQIDE